MLYSLELFETCFLHLCVNEVAVFKTFKSLLNLFQTNGPKNKKLLWLKLLFLKGVFKAICDLVLNPLLERTNSSFTYNGEVHLQYLKTFVATRCSTLSFVGSLFINSLVPIWWLNLFKPKHLCKVTCIFFLFLAN